jgi:hypothetical protein
MAQSTDSYTGGRKIKDSELNGSKHFPTVNNVSKIIPPRGKFLTFVLKSGARGAPGTSEVNILGLLDRLFFPPAVAMNSPHFH